jgi:hypothetical protein
VKEIKEIQNGKEKVKSFLFSDDMILYLKIINIPPKNLLGLTNSIGKVSVYKINTQSQ